MASAFTHQLISLALLLLLYFPSISELNNPFYDAGSEYGGIQSTWSLKNMSSKIFIKCGTVVNAHHQQIADVYIEDGVVVAVQPNIKVGDDVKMLDATEKYVMPGINFFKFFMAYKGSFMINDEILIEGFKGCKSLGALAMVHAENGDAIFEGQKMMIELGITGPEGHALSRPPLIYDTVSVPLEGEATARAICLAKFVNTPPYVVHVMSMDAMEEIARAQKAGVRIIAGFSFF